MSQNLRNYTHAVYTLDAVVQRVEPDQWDNQSPCAEWTAREVLGHVIWHATWLANMCEGGPVPAEQAEAEVPGADPLATWNAARTRVLANLDAEGVLQRIIPGPFGETTIDGGLTLPTGDIMTHAWDIGQACGVEAVLPDVLVEQTTQALSAAGDVIRAPGLFGPAVEPADGASLADRYPALAGRRPLASS